MNVTSFETSAANLPSPFPFHSSVCKATRFGRATFVFNNGRLFSLEFGVSTSESQGPTGTFHVSPQEEQFAEKVVNAIDQFDSAALRWLREQEVPLTGTSFQKLVWRELQRIPFGETRTYSNIAQAIGLPKAVRAVASACAANRLALFVPCHRVVRSDGQMSGFRWGQELKRELLALEATLLV